MTTADSKLRAAISKVLMGFYVESCDPRFTDAEDEELCISALVAAISPILDAVRIEGERAAWRVAAIEARNCAHTCMSEAHCDFLHAAHGKLADHFERRARSE